MLDFWSKLLIKQLKVFVFGKELEKWESFKNYFYESIVSLKIETFFNFF